MSSIGRDITAYCLSFRTKWYFNKAKPCRFYPSQLISVDKQGSCRKLIAARARTRQNARRHQSEGSCKIALGAIIKRIRSKKKNDNAYEHNGAETSHLFGFSGFVFALDRKREWRSFGTRLLQNSANASSVVAKASSDKTRQGLRFVQQQGKHFNFQSIPLVSVKGSLNC